MKTYIAYYVSLDRKENYFRTIHAYSMEHAELIGRRWYRKYFRMIDLEEKKDVAT